MFFEEIIYFYLTKHKREHSPAKLITLLKKKNLSCQKAIGKGDILVKSSRFRIIHERIV